jgi:hypothetical protein
MSYSKTATWQFYTGCKGTAWMLYFGGKGNATWSVKVAFGSLGGSFQAAF